MLFTFVGLLLDCGLMMLVDLCTLLFYAGPISYLDDVPFKINDKFRCPAKVGLPVGFCPPDCVSLLMDTQVCQRQQLCFLVSS